MKDSVLEGVRGGGGGVRGCVEGLLREGIKVRR